MFSLYLCAFSPSSLPSKVEKHTGEVNLKLEIDTRCQWLFVFVVSLCGRCDQLATCPGCQPAAGKESS